MSNIRSNAIVAAELIRAYWRRPEHEGKYEKPDVKITPVSYEIISNIKNGYPPLLAGA